MKDKPAIIISDNFRTPLKMEQQLGLWVDRIGAHSSTENNIPDKLRMLNLYAAVAVIAGNGILETSAFGSFKINQGDIILLFPEYPARYGSKSGWQTEWIVWNGNDADNMISAGYFSPATPVIRNALDIHSPAIKRLRQLIECEDLAAVMERKIVLLNMLLEYYRIANHSDISRYQLTVSRALNIINDHIHDSISIVELARQCGFSEPHLRRIFKQQTGMPPSEYIAGHKISLAKQLLGNNIPVKEIANSLSFCDEFHFRKMFPKITGSTVRQYRNGAIL